MRVSAVAEWSARVGFVGLGDQGYPMAERILRAGFPLTVFARRPGVVDGLVALGATTADSVAELADASDVLGVCVGDDGEVIDVCTAALPSMRASTILLIHSTVLPGTCAAIAERATSRGVRVLDAPVSGGRTRAFAGELTIMVGGDATTLAEVRPILEACGTLVVHLGPLGSGQLLKLVNNAVFTAQVAVTDETLALVRHLGLDPLGAMTVLAASTGSSRCIEMCVAGGGTAAFPRHSEGRRRGAELLAKDVAHFRDVMADRQITVPVELERLVGSGIARAIAAGATDG
jgi:3-hydroxyisobutyrate dehydrogenase